MAGAVSRWLGSVEGLSEIAQRLLRVQIENAPALEVIRRYDSPETLFYCDPPYVHESRSDTRAYAYEMTDCEHRKLAEVLHNVEGKVALSGYHSALMQELYRDWQYIEAPTKKAHSTNTGADNNKHSRTEVLWVNYDVRVCSQSQEKPTWENRKQYSQTLFSELENQLTFPFGGFFRGSHKMGLVESNHLCVLFDLWLYYHEMSPFIVGKGCVSLRSQLDKNG